VLPLADDNSTEDLCRVTHRSTSRLRSRNRIQPEHA